MKLFLTTLGVMMICGAAVAQTETERVLLSVEQHSTALKARRELTGAQILESRSANNLENPQVGYERLWRRPAEAGVSGEWTAVQPFDFPTAYAHRSKRAALQAAQYGHEYAMFRQQVLLEAQETCLRIISLRQMKTLLDRRMSDAGRLLEAYTRLVETGDANALELNKVKVDLLDTRSQARQNEVDLAALEAHLVTLNGGLPLVFAGGEYERQAPLPTQDEMLARYRESDPQLLSLQSEWQASERDIRVSQSENLPKFELGYKHEYALGERANGIAAGMTIPLFEGRGKVKQARAQARFAQNQLADARTSMESTLAQLYAKASLLRETIDEYHDLLVPERSEALLEKALDAGQIDIMHYLAEIEILSQIRKTMIETECEYRLVCARIGMIDL